MKREYILNFMKKNRVKFYTRGKVIFDDKDSPPTYKIKFSSKNNENYISLISSGTNTKDIRDEFSLFFDCVPNMPKIDAILIGQISGVIDDVNNAISAMTTEKINKRYITDKLGDYFFALGYDIE